MDAEMIRSDGKLQHPALVLYTYTNIQIARLRAKPPYREPAGRGSWLIRAVRWYSALLAGAGSHVHQYQLLFTVTR